MILSPENKRWIETFQAEHGRLPSILHIGNIANNAYNNAKLLIEAGLDCDVICYDYYHIMGCPEWEDADFSSDYGDQFKPDWAAAGVKNFKRPRWFAQGPAMDCINYLIAKRKGNFREADRRWRKLAALNGIKLTTSSGWQTRLSLLAFRLQHFLERILKYFNYMALSPGIASKIANSCDAGRIAVRLNSEITRLFAAWSLISVSIIMRIVGYPVMRFFTNPIRIDDKSATLVRAFTKAFPSRSDVLSAADLSMFHEITPHWKRLFNCYDYLIAYSTDPILPLICGRFYFAFEHGTIREIPYRPTAEGRLTALSYRLASHVFVTNFDCVQSAKNLAQDQFTVINHPYDEDHGLSVLGANRLRAQMLTKLDADFIFLHPTRQDWVEGTGYADKANDIFIRAFAMLRKEGQRVGLVCCSWGANVQETCNLLDELDCSRHVEWVAPMAIMSFERMCRACDIVVDQFKLGAFGGVLFKALAVGAPVLTYLDEERLLSQYAECPPVVNCRTTDDILIAMKVLIPSKERLAALGKASRSWMKKFHGKIETVNKQINVYRNYPPM